MTGRQLIGQVMESLSINSDDSTIDERLILDLIAQNRSNALRNEYNRMRSVDSTNLQVIPCFELELVDSTTCCGDVITGCKILKSVEPLPNAIELHLKDGIQDIKPNKITAPNINYVSVDKIPYVSSDTISSKLLYAFIWNQYLYLYSTNDKYMLIESVTIRGMFEDPFLAGSVGCNADSCFNLDSQYPLEGWMWQTLVKPQVINELLARHTLPRDNDSDSKDSSF